MVPDVTGVFVVGDVAALSLQDGRPLPGVAQVAIQQGRYVGQVISQTAQRHNRRRRPFRYFDKGNMAVVGKNFAILERGRLRMSGFVTWLVWVFIHVMFLPQLQNRLRVETAMVLVILDRAAQLAPDRRSRREVGDRAGRLTCR